LSKGRVRRVSNGHSDRPEEQIRPVEQRRSFGCRFPLANKHRPSVEYFKRLFDFGLAIMPHSTSLKPRRIYLWQLHLGRYNEKDHSRVRGSKIGKSATDNYYSPIVNYDGPDGIAEIGLLARKMKQFIGKAWRSETSPRQRGAVKRLQARLGKPQ
jgi:hypothetical protein